MKTTILLFPAFNKLQLKLLLLVASIFIVLHLSAQDSILCKVPWIPSFFAVTEVHSDVPQSFWLNNSTDNVIDADSNNFAKAVIKNTGSATIRVSDADSMAVYNEATYVGYYIRSKVFTDGIFDGVTITTYLNGVLEETFSGDELLIDSIPLHNNVPIHLGFITTRVFNQIELTLDSSGGKANYDVYFAVVQDCTAGLPPLSVRWLTFTASQKGNSSQLQWRTAEEINNAGFEVERSKDGRYFTTIGKVSPAIDVNNIYTYYFTDIAPIDGMNYYRIKQVDQDGKVNYSMIRSLEFSNQVSTIRTWPNPVSAALTVDFNQHHNSGTLRIVNATGIVELDQKFDSADQRVSLDLSTLSPGIYTLIIEYPYETHVERIFKAE
jgi:hypothetical protein